MNKRILSILIPAVGLLLLNACNTKTAEKPEDAPAHTPVFEEISQNAESEETAPKTYPGPDVADLSGFALRIATTPFNDYNKMIFSEEQNGEVVNDALYEANSKVFQEYNCSADLELFTSFPDVTEGVKKSVNAGDDAYDISYNHDNQTVANALSGCFLNVKQCDIYDFEAPWWTRTSDDFTIGGGLYFVSNYLTYSPLYCGLTMVYNKDLARDLNIEIPYDDIFNGNWYMDGLLGLLEGTTADLNGDGAVTLGEDQYGFITGHGGVSPLQTSLGIEVLGKDEEGYLQLVLDPERAIQMLEKIDKLMENGINANLVDNEWGYGTKYFKNHQAVFNYLPIRRVASELRDIDFSLGALPVPKLDENQTDYISGAYDTYWAVLKTAYGRQDQIATVLEAMSYQCYYNVLPVVYETVLQVKLSNSQEDSRIYEIIKNSLLVDVGYAFNEQDGSGLFAMVRLMSNTDAGTFSSFYSSKIKQTAKILERLNNKFREMNAEYGNP